MDRRKIDVVVTSLLILAGIIILINDDLSTGGIEATSLDSLFLPRLVSVFMILLCAVIGIQSFLKIKNDEPNLPDEIISISGFLGVFLYIGIFVAYWFFTPYLGFLVTTPFIMLAIALLLGGRNWWVMIPVSCVTTLLVFYGCRHFLRVYLPTWSLG